VFRIFQEMLSNVARHSGASAVRIRIRLLAHELQMEVADNGVGAQPAALEHKSSYGVMGMRERALHFGGTLRIDGNNGDAVSGRGVGGGGGGVGVGVGGGVGGVGGGEGGGHGPGTRVRLSIPLRGAGA
jgi:hypothetical protein